MFSLAALQIMKALLLLQEKLTKFPGWGGIWLVKQMFAALFFYMAGLFRVICQYTNKSNEIIILVSAAINNVWPICQILRKWKQDLKTAELKVAIIISENDTHRS